jgi:hypothetical protein
MKLGAPRGRPRFAASGSDGDRLRSRDALENLLEESALWTALWAGFPFSDKRDPARSKRSQT